MVADYPVGSLRHVILEYLIRTVGTMTPACGFLNRCWPQGGMFAAAERTSFDAIRPEFDDPGRADRANESVPDVESNLELRCWRLAIRLVDVEPEHDPIGLQRLVPDQPVGRFHHSDQVLVDEQALACEKSRDDRSEFAAEFSVVRMQLVRQQVHRAHEAARSPHAEGSLERS